MTLLRRLGNKQAMAKKLLPYFPPHDIYIEPFFGAGGMFFNKPRAKHNFLNDMDSEVFNLYMVVLEERERLKFELARMPVHQKLWEHWKTNIPEDRVLRAVRFLLYSNFGYMGKPDTLHVMDTDSRAMALEEIELLDFGSSTKITCMDFEKALASIAIRDKDDGKWEAKTFIYADPPYLGTNNNYESAFTEQDTQRLFDVLIAKGCRFAISEFDNPAVIAMAQTRGLQVHTIGARQNMKNRRTEILITNYAPSVQGLLF